MGGKPTLKIEYDHSPSPLHTVTYRHIPLHTLKVEYENSPSPFLSKMRNAAISSEPPKRFSNPCRLRSYETTLTKSPIPSHQSAVSPPQYQPLVANPQPSISDHHPPVPVSIQRVSGE